MFITFWLIISSILYIYFFLSLPFDDKNLLEIFTKERIESKCGKNIVLIFNLVVISKRNKEGDKYSTDIIILFSFKNKKSFIYDLCPFKIKSNIKFS